MKKKRSIVNRIVLLIAGLGLSLCALWGANDMSVYSDKKGGLVSLFLFILECAAWLYFLFTFLVFSKGLTEDRYFQGTGGVLILILSAVCSSFLFGAIVAPIGHGIGVWVTPWDFLLILGGLPLFFVIEDIVIEIVVARQAGFV